MNPPVIKRVTLRYNDLDPYGHVNNAVYPPIFLDDPLHGAANIPTIGNRSYAMDFEMRTSESFEGGLIVAEGFAAHEVKPCPDWFLPAVAKLEGRPEKSFVPETG